jgi:lysophospholipase L1-like esterase
MQAAPKSRMLAIKAALIGAMLAGLSAWSAEPVKETRSDCLVMGDSIAVGVAQFSACKTLSTGGLSSWRWLDKWGGDLDRLNPSVVLISLGANDGADPRSRKALAAVRSKVRASKVMWLAPSATLAPEPRKWVRAVAGQFGDRVFELPQEHLQKDGIHLSWAGSKLVVRSLL